MSTWAKRAACIGADPETFFPGKGDKARAKEAKRICDSCPVVSDCRLHALTHPEEYGLWGGATESELRRIRKGEPEPQPRQLVPCGTESAYHRHIRYGETPCNACRTATNTAQRRRHAERQRTTA